MLYNLFLEYAGDISFLNVMRYLSFRSVGAMLTALIFCFIFGEKIIDWMRTWQKGGQPIRKDGPKSHIMTKKGTPTMGGIMMLIAVMIGALLWIDLYNCYFWIVTYVTLAYAFIGFLDDYLKIAKRNSKGISGKCKLLLQFAVAFSAIFLIQKLSISTQANHIALPFIKDILLDLGWFYIIFTAIVIVGTANAVNLTDGLDGLAIMPIMIATVCFGIISYLVGNTVFADYLHIYYVEGTGELVIFCATVVGAGLGFLWFNAPPAKIFMGDTGSLAFGGMLGTIAVIAKHELVLLIIGGLFVMEALSVIIQVGSFKLRGKRVFKMAPIHHHFEKKGWAEPTIVIRFWIIAIIFALIGLATLKLR